MITTDVLIVMDGKDENENYVPVDKVFDIVELIRMEGLRFRYAYITSRALEYGSANLFQSLYYNAKLSGGKVLHVSDYRSDE